jgi:indolepyruvate ferredoxin oxidoreductase alpha subunit
MTGHQEHPATGKNINSEPTKKLDCRHGQGLGIENVRVVDPLKLDQLQQAVQEELERREPSVIIAKRACA